MVVGPILVSVVQLSWSVFDFFPCYPSSGEGHFPVEGAAALLPPGDLICWAYQSPKNSLLSLEDLDHWVQWEHEQNISRSRSRWPKMYFLGAMVNLGNRDLVLGCSCHLGGFKPLLFHLAGAKRGLMFCFCLRLVNCVFPFSPALHIQDSLRMRITSSEATLKSLGWLQVFSEESWCYLLVVLVLLGRDAELTSPSCLWFPFWLSF